MLFEMTLTVILALHHEIEDIKARDPMVKVRQLIGDYHVEAEAKRRTLREQVTAKAARVDAISMTIYGIISMSHEQRL